jgi:hypothetical protein
MYCRKIFLEKHNNFSVELPEKNLNILSLNLAFYLASWGISA